MTAEQVLDLYEDTRARLRALATEATRRPKITTRAEVMRPLFTHDHEAVAAGIGRADDDARNAFFRNNLPEDSDLPATLVTSAAPLSRREEGVRASLHLADLKSLRDRKRPRETLSWDQLWANAKACGPGAKAAVIAMTEVVP